MAGTAAPGVQARTVRCPACGGDSLYAPSNPYRPFCCERCRQVDFGAWASERFALPGSGEPDGPDGPGSRGD
jgi:uncharacterized protein